MSVAYLVLQRSNTGVHRTFLCFHLLKIKRLEHIVIFSLILIVFPFSFHRVTQSNALNFLLVPWCLNINKWFNVTIQATERPDEEMKWLYRSKQRILHVCYMIIMVWDTIKNIQFFFKYQPNQLFSLSNPKTHFILR